MSKKRFYSFPNFDFGFEKVVNPFVGQRCIDKHCMCQSVSIGSIPHKQCCMCDYRQVDSPTYTDNTTYKG